MEVCRSFNYYVDSMSLQTTELGTQDFPYKDLKSVFAELLNIHSFSNSSIIIYIKEGTSNYLNTQSNYFLNINSVTLTSYSDESTNAGRATVIATDDVSAAPWYSIPTQFNMLQNSTLMFAEKVTNNANLSSSDSASLITSNSIFTIYKTTVHFDSIDFSSNFSSVTYDSLIFELFSMQGLLYTLRNSDIGVSGAIFESTQQSDIYIENLYIDYYQNSYGFYFFFLCFTPFIPFTSEVNIHNVTIYLSQDKVYGIQDLMIFAYIGGANFHVSNFNMSAYLDTDPLSYNFLTLIDSGWTYLDSFDPIVEIDTFYMTQPDSPSRSKLFDNPSFMLFLYQNLRFLISFTLEMLISYIWIFQFYFHIILESNWSLS